MRGVAYLFFSHADLRLGDATQIMPDMLNKEGEGSYDFVFIDADKENYDIYYEKGLQLIRKGGVIIVDNTLWQGYVADPEIKEDATTVAIRKLNDKVSFSSLLSNIQWWTILNMIFMQILRDTRVEISILPVADGVTLARKL